MAALKNFWSLIKTSGSHWVEDKASRLGAAISYYTVFAIPPLFVIVIFIASLVMNPNTVRSAMMSQVGGLIGQQGAHAIETAMTAQSHGKQGILPGIIAAVTLLITASGLFLELQGALNSIWGVEEKPGQGIRGLIKNRLLSFAMIVGIGFLLLVSLVVSTALSGLGKMMSHMIPGMGAIWMGVNFIVSFLVIAALFAMIFKVLPDVKLSWRDVWVGGATTALLFTIGKFLLGMYLGKNSTVSAYGAAGSLVLILLWVYYSAQILFFGAEITQVYANRFGARLEPKPHAQWISGENPDVKSRKQNPAPEPKPLPARQTRLVSDLKREVGKLRKVVEH
ncbi:MAG TPA: YihY/virulence factor BrkB family protein [Verrucomicrobiae bacterium]|nr:YihY/virulence factor BrkB family protein [Verrucomicrobiae bacterium]